MTNYYYQWKKSKKCSSVKQWLNESLQQAFTDKMAQWMELMTSNYLMDCYSKPALFQLFKELL